MPRELIARQVEEDFSRECEESPCGNPLHVLEHREYDLTVDWSRFAGAGPGWADDDTHDGVRVSVRHAAWGPPVGELVDGAWVAPEGRVPGVLMEDGVPRYPLASRELWSDYLSRKQINHLIKTLRKARDQVFGVDE